MKTLATLSLLALAVSAEAASHRLAYSKAENVEVFVEHADGQAWCSDNLTLRFAFASTPDIAAVERLLPKLGSLFSSQCPSAQQLSWTSQHANGQAHASGKASLASGWAVQVDASPAQAAASTPDSVATENSATAQTSTPAAAVSDANPAPASAPVNDSTPAEPAPAAPAPATPSSSPLAEADNTPDTTREAAPAVAPVKRDFAVAGWQPPSSSQALAKAEFLVEVQDSQGCRFRLGFQPDEALNNISVQSQQVSCGSDGYASGPGSLLLTRSDGKRLYQFEGSFISGLTVEGNAPALPVVGFDGNKNLLLLLHSEPANQTHYLLRLARNWNGYWSAGNADVIALTEDREQYRTLEAINRNIELATTRLDSLLPRLSNLDYYAMRDLEQGLLKGNRDYWLYQVQVSRHYRSKQWQFNPQYAQNHLFNLEKKEAEQQRQAELQRQREEQLQRELQARQAEQQLALYRQLRRDARKPEALYQRILSDISYNPMGGGDYAALMRGESRAYRQIVEITGEQDGLWQVEYPYPALLDSRDSEQQAGKGWYLVQGQVSLDPERLDEQQLPLTLVNANSLLPCEEKGCSDLRDPLSLVRLEVGDAQWTPERAKELIKQAWPDRAQDAGDDE